MLYFNYININFLSINYINCINIYFFVFTAESYLSMLEGHGCVLKCMKE